MLVLKYRFTQTDRLKPMFPHLLRRASQKNVVLGPNLDRNLCSLLGLMYITLMFMKLLEWTMLCIISLEAYYMFRCGCAVVVMYNSG